MRVDNSVNDRVYPQKADFTFYGGIYRDVSLLVVNKNHIALGHFGDTGVKITPVLKEGSADIQVETLVEGEGTVAVELLDAAGSTVAKGEGEKTSLHLDAPHLWNGVKDPYLYTCIVRLMQDGKPVDEVTTKVGLRSFSVDAKKGFFLNGKPYPLHGVSRHQDRKGLGNAITREMHDEDMALIRELGANTVRLAHYQHDQYFYDLCDKYGMVVWAEIPYISEHLPNGRENTISQMKELIYQNYNHPSIVCWGVSNEITISTKDKADMLDNHRVLNELCHKIPMVADCSDYETYRSGNYIPGIMGTLFSLVDKLMSRLSATVVGIAVSFVGLQSLPTQYDPYTPGMNWVVIVLFCIIPMVAWAATLIAMKGYTLTGAKMKEIQAVNACRRDAVAKGMKLEEAMDKWQTMEQLPEEYRS